MDKARARNIADQVRSGRSVLVLCESRHHIDAAAKAVASQIPEGVCHVHTGTIRRGDTEVRFISLMGPDGRRPSEFDWVVADFEFIPENNLSE